MRQFKIHCTKILIKSKRINCTHKTAFRLHVYLKFPLKFNLFPPCPSPYLPFPFLLPTPPHSSTFPTPLLTSIPSLALPPLHPTLYLSISKSTSSPPLPLLYLIPTLPLSHTYPSLPSYFYSPLTNLHLHPTPSPLLHIPLPLLSPPCPIPTTTFRELSQPYIAPCTPISLANPILHMIKEGFGH